MSDICNNGHVRNQINNPVIEGDLVIHGDRKVKRFLTALPSSIKELVGREVDLSQLKEVLSVSQRVVLVNGMGGVGKTTLAAAYLNQNLESFLHIAWVEQANYFVTSLAKNKLLLNNLGLKSTEDEVVDAKAVLNELSNLPGPSLLVFDNADESLAAFQNYLPKGPNWQVLITSREELDFAKQYALDFLSEENALQLFYTHYKHDKNDEVLCEVLSIIDYHTLTIELLAKICQDCRIKYLESIQQILNTRGLAIGRRANITSAHSQTERIEKLLPYLQAIFDIGDNINVTQKQLLIQFVGLPPIPIPFDHLNEILNGDNSNEKDIDDLQYDLKELTRKGFIGYNSNDDSYKMHRVIQSVIKTKFDVDLEKMDVVINGIEDFLTMRNGDQPGSRLNFVQYGDYILDNFSNLTDNKGRIADMKYTVASTLSVSGHDEPAAKLFEEVLSTHINIYGENHYQVAFDKSMLAQSYVGLGLRQQAYDLLLNANSILIDHYGEKYAVRIGFNYRKIGEILASDSQDELADIYKNAGFEILKLALGPNHPTVELFGMLRNLRSKADE